MKLFIGRSLVCLGLIGMVQLVSCRKTETESAGGKSLDTLAGKVDANSLEQCTGNLKGNQGIVNLLAGHHDKLQVQSKHADQQAALKKEVADILESSIPTPLVGAFLANNGRIIVSPAAAEWCSKADEAKRRYPNLSEYELSFAKANQEQILGCWSKGINEFATNYNIVIHMDPKEAEAGGDAPVSKKILRNTLVRMFGYVSGQLLSQIDFNVEDEAIVDGIDSVDFNKLKSDLADAFVTDVSKSMQADLQTSDTMAGKALWAEILKSSEKDPVAAWTSVKADTTKTKLKDAFEDFVFAEAFDSRLCNQKTRDSMNEGQRFSETGKIYNQVGEMFESIEDTLVAGATDEAIVAATTLEIAGGAGGTNLTQMRFFRRVFGGLYRVTRAIFRGAVRVAGWVVRGAVRVVQGAVRVIGAAVRTVAHAVGHAVRFVARVGWVVGRAAVRSVAAVHNWIWYGNRYRSYYFRPQYVQKTAGLKLAAMGLDPADTKEIGIVAVPRTHEPNADWDNDGVPNNQDQCSNTGRISKDWVKWGEKPPESILAQKPADYKYFIVEGPYKGCARGQNLDYFHYRQTSDYTGNYYNTDGDLDADGVPDAADRCSNTPAFKKVWTTDSKSVDGLNYLGCSGGQMVDR